MQMVFSPLIENIFAFLSRRIMIYICTCGRKGYSRLRGYLIERAMCHHSDLDVITVFTSLYSDIVEVIDKPVKTITYYAKIPGRYVRKKLGVMAQPESGGVRSDDPGESKDVAYMNEIERQRSNN